MSAAIVVVAALLIVIVAFGAYKSGIISGIISEVLQAIPTPAPWTSPSPSSSSSPTPTPHSSSAPTTSGLPCISQEVVVKNGETTVTYSVTNVVGLAGWQIAIHCPEQAFFVSASFAVGSFPQSFTVVQPIGASETWVAALFLTDETWSGSGTLVTVTFETAVASTFFIKQQYTKLIDADNQLMPYSTDPTYTVP